uniref:Uncharacterized protein n=1 Tax=Arundo donax TaxID=35708 RepID=A0A0A8XUM8_ARUDO
MCVGNHPILGKYMELENKQGPRDKNNQRLELETTRFWLTGGLAGFGQVMCHSVKNRQILLMDSIAAICVHFFWSM